MKHRDPLVVINTFKKAFASLRRSQKNRKRRCKNPRQDWQSKLEAAEQKSGKRKGDLQKVLKCSDFIVFAPRGVFILHKGPLQLCFRG